MPLALLFGSLRLRGDMMGREGEVPDIITNAVCYFLEFVELRICILRNDKGSPVERSTKLDHFNLMKLLFVLFCNPLSSAIRTFVSIVSRTDK